VNVEPVGAGQQGNDRPSNQFDDVWGNAASWGQPAQATPALPATQNLESNTAATETPQTPANNSQISSAATNAAQPTGVPPAAGQPNVPARQRDEPWLPLLLVSLSLMGSLSANLFLGWSYMDARQKYRALVRKTADKFRRAAAA
jgi:hypothetical protein